MEDQVSYTLRRVVDELQAKLSNNSQNVTTYDHLIGFGVNDPTQGNEIEQPFEEFRQHYNQIFETLNQIRSDVGYIDTQLQTLANENRNGNDAKSRWILSKGSELTRLFIDTMTRFKLTQQNHLNSLRTKHHQLDQLSWSADANEEVREKQKIIAQCLQRVQTDLADNEYKVSYLSRLFEEPYIPDEGSVQDFDHQPVVHIQLNDQPGRNQMAYEEASRKQRLWLVIFGALVLVVLIILLIVVIGP